MTQKTEKKLISFLEENLSKKDFDRIPGTIGISETKFTRLKNGTANFRYEEIRDLILLLKEAKAYPKNMPIEQFITTYSIGDSITMSQMRMLNEHFILHT